MMTTAASTGMPATAAFDESLRLFLRDHLAEAPKALAESIRYIVLSPGKHLRPRVLLASAQMMSVKQEAALSAAVALEMIRCSALIHHDPRDPSASHKKFDEAMALLTGDALLPLATEAFLEAAPHVEAENFFRALRRLATSTGPSGIIGGQAEQRQLTAESTLDDLRQVNAKRAASFFSAAILIPKDFAGIADDSSQGLALDIFAQELGLAFQTMNDLKNMVGENISPSHILFYLPLKEAKSMTLQRLNSATLSLSSAWGPPSQALVQIAEEISREIQAAS